MLLAISLSWLLRFLLPFSFDPSTPSDVIAEDTVSWQSKRLTWDDFNGRADRRYMNTVALTSSSINIFITAMKAILPSRSRAHFTEEIPG